MSVVARYALALICIGSYNAAGQTSPDSVIMLDEVVLSQSRLDAYAITGMRISVDSTTLRIFEGRTLTELFQLRGIGLIRSYSPGGLGTATLRGTGSSHTAILWHGISLASPMNGQFDLSQVPVGLFNNAEVREGGNATLYGSGSIGGTIQLRKDPNFNRGFHVGAGVNAGSYGMISGNGNAGYSSEKFSMSASVLVRNSDNDFTYTHPLTGENTRWQHARQELTGVGQDMDWQIAARHYVYSRFWFQEGSYQVPNPSTVIRPGTAEQDDTAYRGLIGYNYTSPQLDIHYQAAVLQQNLQYADSVTGIATDNQAMSLIQHIEATGSIGANGTLTGGLRYIFERGKTSAYGTEIPTRNRIILSTAYALQPWNRWQVSLGLREEIIDGNTTPLAPFLNVKGALSRVFSTELSVQRNYRIPTFNDLYWMEAGARGNRDLSAEVSVGGEIGLITHLPGTTIHITAFSQWINDWIQWIPADSRTWSPMNIKQVWSRGIQSSAEYEVVVNKFVIKPSGSYRYTLSTNAKVYEDTDDQEAGKQLILTPVHSGTLGLSAGYGSGYIQWTAVITGNQYTTSDNNVQLQLDPYVVSALDIAWHLSVKKLKLGLNAGINNLFNSQYEARPGYPMPGRTYNAGVNINFN